MFFLIFLATAASSSFIPRNEKPTYHRNYGDDFLLGQYHTNDEISAWLMQNVSTVTNVTVIGMTEEKNELYAVTIGNGTSNSSSISVVECGIHAREWISHAFCLFIIHELLYGYYQVCKLMSSTLCSVVCVNL